MRSKQQARGPANTLAISQRGKAIPYGPVNRGSDGQNRGYSTLKGNLAAIPDVPEARDDDALRLVLYAINPPETAFFTIGCDSGPAQESDGFRRYGYIEFAFDDLPRVSEAASYFPPFFYFSQLWHRHADGHVAYFTWEIEGASFWELKCDGFTCSVTVNTEFYDTNDAALECWAHCLDLLTTQLLAVPQAKQQDRLHPKK
jgi:hypothetical protein